MISIGPAGFNQSPVQREKIGYLKQDRQEKLGIKRTTFVKAWRVVDENDEDLFQPWCRTIKEAKETCKELGITLKERTALGF